MKLDYEKGENNSIESTILRNVKINLLIIKNLVLFRYGNFLILIHIIYKKNQSFLNNYRSNAFYEYSV